MSKLKVTTIFQDKVTDAVYRVGEEITIDDADRVKDLVNRGLAEVIEAPKPKKTAKSKEQ